MEMCPFSIPFVEIDLKNPEEALRRMAQTEGHG